MTRCHGCCGGVATRSAWSVHAGGARRVRDVRVERVVCVEHVPLSESDGPYIIAVSHHSKFPTFCSMPHKENELA